MAAVNDGYDAYYADKIWKLIPAVYRQLDSDVPGLEGPLREMVNRIGTQAAILRRSIDRLWEDQSIETCDDWVVPYVGDLLATNLVPSLDGRGRRVDVARTIHYRRGAGTLAVLEEVAHDITGWEVRVVEFFRRLLRTRHLLDPDIGSISQDPVPTGDTLVQRASELVGAFSFTPLGGYANLRNAFGATQTDTAFDEFSHYADFRYGRGKTGWYEIQKLGVFVWRLRSYGVTRATPVPCTGGNLYAFDPTGRTIPLFARATRTTPASYDNDWTPVQEWQLPGPISTPLYTAELANLYPLTEVGSVLVYHNTGTVFDGIPPCSPLLPADTPRCVTVYPELGTFKITPPTPINEELGVSYYYGFSSEVGAGPFDRRRVIAASPLAIPVTSVEGGHNFAPGARGTWTILDSRTYDNVSDPAGPIASKESLVLMSRNQQRPLLKLSTPWTFTGAGGSLYLEGLLISGSDVVLTGNFDLVRIACCTLDPGNRNPDPNAAGAVAKSVAGTPLMPTRLLIEGQVRQLEIDHSIVGPVRDEASGVTNSVSVGQVELLRANDSIVQGIRTVGSGLLTGTDFQDAVAFFSRLIAHPDLLAKFVWDHLMPATQNAVNAYLNPAGAPPSQAFVAAAVAADINGVLNGPSIYDPDRFRSVVLDPDTLARVAAPPAGADLVRFNRALLDEGFPGALADLALMITTGEVDLARCTVLGGGYVHRLTASECILDDMFVTEDAQYGCVRFSAWSTGSAVPRKYESVEIARAAPIFTSREFGDPGYCQLRDSVDLAISSGGPNGSEMGAFASEKNAIKERSLLLKYQEFMPLGLTPVVIDVT